MVVRQLDDDFSTLDCSLPNLYVLYASLCSRSGTYASVLALDGLGLGFVYS